MIELVIKIPEEKYKAITEMYETFPKDMKDWGLEAIKNGIPLPKGHGRLIDESRINKCYMPVNYLDVRGIRTDAPTIIEGSESE